MMLYHARGCHLVPPLPPFFLCVCAQVEEEVLGEFG